MPTRLAVLALVPLLALAGGCSTPKVRMTSVIVPEWREAVRLRRVAIQPVAGEAGRELTASVTNALAAARLRDVPCFAVVPWPAPALPAARAVETGRALGVDAVYAAKVALADVHGESRDSTRCEELARDGTCKKEVEQVCRWTEARFVLEVRIHDVVTGRVVHAGDVEGNARDDESCSDVPDGFLGRMFSGTVNAVVETVTGYRSAMLRDARNDAVARLVARVTPRVVEHEVPLLEAGDGVPREARRRLKAALRRFGRGGSPAALCAAVEEAAGQAPEDPAIVHDLAVCAEGDGRLDEARDLYRRAAGARAANEALALEGLARVERQLADHALLAAAAREGDGAVAGTPGPTPVPQPEDSVSPPGDGAPLPAPGGPPPGDSAPPSRVPASAEP